MKFKKGDNVTWDTWGRGINPHTFTRNAVHHSGHVFEVIPAGTLPHEVNPVCRGVASTCTPRKEESYVVYEYTQLYWPRTKSLFPDPCMTPSSTKESN